MQSIQCISDLRMFADAIMSALQHATALPRESHYANGRSVDKLRSAAARVTTSSELVSIMRDIAEEEGKAAAVEDDIAQARHSFVESRKSNSDLDRDSGDRQTDPGTTDRQVLTKV